MQPAVSITLVMHPNPSRTRRGVVMVRARTIIKNISGHLPSGNPNRGLACPVRHTRQKAIKIKSGSHLPSANPNRGLAFQARHTDPSNSERPPPAQRPSHPGMRRILYALGSQIGSAVHPARPGQARQSHLGRGTSCAPWAGGSLWAARPQHQQRAGCSGLWWAGGSPSARSASPMDQFAQGMYRCMELIREFTELWGALHHFPPPPPFPNISRRRFEKQRSPG
ncbi:hypothetical protein PAPYR_11106 [Paratrimastix pyriformis]|uniref:Uncharacterized protein n=1 Tax=Paratrimastix pyriformis TaxID=342808 RepID=A0ABQ8U758_9EUKA|nr:hypothetical protein PAPYR_11106 [Paratrimastix pyriformis]